MPAPSSSFSPRLPPPWLLEPNLVPGVPVQAERYSWFISLCRETESEITQEKNIQEKWIYIIKRWYRLGVHWLALFTSNCPFIQSCLSTLVPPDVTWCLLLPIFDPYPEHPKVSFIYSTNLTQATCNSCYFIFFSLWQLQCSR